MTQDSEAKSPVEDDGRPVFKTEDPSTGLPLNAYRGYTREEALAIARKAHEAFKDWRKTSFGERAQMMKAAAATLRRRHPSVR